MRLTQPTGRPNFHLLHTNRGDVWFSYETPIAIMDNIGRLLISENEWGPTTGRHINHIKRENPIYTQVPHDEIMEWAREIGN